MQQLLNDFLLHRFRFRYHVKRPVRIPDFTGSVLRSVFGKTLRESVCFRQGIHCPQCSFHTTCSYAFLFETPVSPHSPYLKGQSFAPHPFILTVPETNKKDYKNGDFLDFEITLFGNAIQYLPLFITSFSQAGQKGIGTPVKGHRGVCELREVFNITVSGDRLIANLSEGITIDSITPFDWQGEFRDWMSRKSSRSQLSMTDLTLWFQNPVRLRSKGRVLTQLDFEQVLRALLRRISILSNEYCHFYLDLDYQGLIHSSGQVRTTASQWKKISHSRYSARQQQSLTLHGIMGRVTYSGELAPFFELLWCGQYTHLGGNTVMGFGKYTIVDD